MVTHDNLPYVLEKIIWFASFVFKASISFLTTASNNNATNIIIKFGTFSNSQGKNVISYV